MRSVHELSLSFPFALPFALRTFLYPQGSSGAFSSRLSGAYITVHGVYTMFGTHQQVL
jgi:hypothetical protein